MKIVFIGGRDLNAIGGIESYTRNLASQLVAMGHEVTVFCESAEDSEETHGALRIIHQRSLPSSYLCKPLLGLRATLRVIAGMRDADVIHYNAWPPALWSPLARLFGIHSIMEGHGLEWKNTKYTPLECKLIRLMEGITAFTNRHLVMCSHSQTRYFMHRYGRKCFTLGSGTDLPRPSAPGASDILDRLGLRGRRYILLLSRLVSVKSPDTLIKAFRRLPESDVRLVLAGEAFDQTYDSYLRRVTDGDPRVVFAGSVTGDDAGCLLRGAYAFCNPSSSEGICISLLEAMAHRVPVIASDIEGNREVLSDDSALWFPPLDIDALHGTLRLALDEPGRLRRGVEANYSLIRSRYLWPAVARNYLRYLKSLPHIRRRYGLQTNEKHIEESLYPT